jgi:alcohol dehydrogenase
MNALVFDGQLRFVCDHPEPPLTNGEAIVEPRLVGICSTDLEITRGYMHFHGILGHEFVGVVHACHDATWIGRRVVGEINAACGNCPRCRSGDPAHCPARTTLGIDRRPGALAQRVSVPVACLHAVPDELADEAAVFVEPVAAALEILEHCHIAPSARVAVVGDGRLGALCALALRLPGCAVELVGRHPERWPLFHTMGIRACAAADVSDAAYDVVVDCTGQPSGLALARRLVRPRGRLVLKSTYVGSANLDLTRLVVDEIQLIGSRCGPFAAALRLLASGLIDPTPLIAGRFPLHDGVAAIAAARGALKILVTP